MIYDRFQKEAIDHISRGHSVIVSAPTGAGKTVIAEHVIESSIQKKTCVIYTAPIKALSNQKYGDLRAQHGAAAVGLLTGDNSINGRAPVVVMTTEVLRNMMYAASPDLADVGVAVLDEVHYLQDRARGPVWEEIIIGAPRDVLLVGLSATVANVKEIADWISIVHRPILPIYHPHRPVPLRYAIADLAAEIHELDEVRRGRAPVIGDERRGPDDRGRWYSRRVADPTVLIEALEARRWLPAIYFIFSRAGCERAMQDVLAEGRTLLTAAQRDEVDHAINQAREESPALGESALSQSVFQGLGVGVAMHHAGILPGLKRLIETLFERGLCRVVFATETMSLGIHMPAKSVALQSLAKRTDRGFRSLTHNELTQMAGRAGRRGMDKEGYAIAVVDRDFLDIDKVIRLTSEDTEPIVSRFQLTWNSVLNLVDNHPGTEIEVILKSNFDYYLRHVPACRRA